MSLASNLHWQGGSLPLYHQGSPRHCRASQNLTKELEIIKAYLSHGNGDALLLNNNKHYTDGALRVCQTTFSALYVY